MMDRPSPARPGPARPKCRPTRSKRNVNSGVDLILPAALLFDSRACESSDLRRKRNEGMTSRRCGARCGCVGFRFRGAGRAERVGRLLGVLRSGSLARARAHDVILLCLSERRGVPAEESFAANFAFGSFFSPKSSAAPP